MAAGSESMKNVIALYRTYTKCNWDDETCTSFDPNPKSFKKPDETNNEEINSSQNNSCPDSLIATIGCDLVQYGPIQILGYEQKLEEEFKQKTQRNKDKIQRLEGLLENKRNVKAPVQIEIYGPTAKCNGPPKSMICEIISTICPPREWCNGELKFRQYASCSIPTRRDVLALKKKIIAEISSNKSITEDGMCFQRRQLITQTFDELIRQVTVACMERGQLLLNIRDEIYHQFNSYRALYDSILATSIKKIFNKHRNIDELENKIHMVQLEIADLETIRSEFTPTYEYFTNKFEDDKKADYEAFENEIEKIEDAKDQLKTLLLKSVTDIKTSEESELEQKI